MFTIADAASSTPGGVGGQSSFTANLSSGGTTITASSTLASARAAAAATSANGIDDTPTSVCEGEVTEVNAYSWSNINANNNKKHNSNKVNYNHQEILYFLSTRWRAVEKELAAGNAQYVYYKPVATDLVAEETVTATTAATTEFTTSAAVASVSSTS